MVIKKNEWFNRRCELARLEREKHGTSGGRNLWEEYKTTGNEYVKIQRVEVEESNFERNN